MAKTGEPPHDAVRLTLPFKAKAFHSQPPRQFEARVSGDCIWLWKPGHGFSGGYWTADHILGPRTKAKILKLAARSG